MISFVLVLLFHCFHTSRRVDSVRSGAKTTKRKTGDEGAANIKHNKPLAAHSGPSQRRILKVGFWCVWFFFFFHSHKLEGSFMYFITKKWIFRSQMWRARESTANGGVAKRVSGGGNAAPRQEACAPCVCSVVQHPPAHSIPHACLPPLFFFFLHSFTAPLPSWPGIGRARLGEQERGPTHVRARRRLFPSAHSPTNTLGTALKEGERGEQQQN